MAKQTGIIPGGSIVISKKTGIPVAMGGALHTANVTQHEDKFDSPLPKGWTDQSRAKFYSSMSHEADECEEGPTTTCMKKIGDHVDNPGAFCASLRDRVTGSTKWRSGGKKK